MTIKRLFELVLHSESNAQVAGAIQLMTVHEAKGNEFLHLFVGGLYDGVFPLIRTKDDEEQHKLDAEKRLFYVAITRTKRFLSILSPSKYDTKNKKSPFINLLLKKPL
jgi:DNA helicase-2/ATP-dependent DNA helicase PcrA